MKCDMYYECAVRIFFSYRVRKENPYHPDLIPMTKR